MMTTERDQRFLASLGDYGILSTRQISEFFFHGIRKTTVLRRLRLLEERKLIRRIQGLADGSLAWCLTGPQAEAMGFEFAFGHSNRNTLDHDVTLNDVRASLRKVGLGEKWTPEHVLRRQSFQKQSYQVNAERIIPDGLLPVRHKEESKTIAVELELHAKARRRYRTLLGEYRWKNSIWGIWYIVPQESIGNLVSDEWQKQNNGKHDTVMWSLLSEVLNDPWNLHVHIGPNSTLMRNLIEMTNPNAQGAAHTQSTASETKAGNQEVIAM